jgi:glycosyltransferase involved in cell wall biosynthesis
MANAVEQPSVSLLTITQYSRRECLLNLSMLIQQQLYKNIVEWVIVEGSRDEMDAIKNADLLSKMKSNIPIHYIPWSAGQSLSDLRNNGNSACNGDIIVCLDDDDYYPPTRVSHAVHRLQNSSALIAGCSKSFIYFYNVGQFFQFKSFGKGHSTNNCLAYKRAYLENHQHLTGLAKGEESSFTNNFTEPMEQLDPMKTIVISGHGTNTVDKSLISPAMLTELNTPALIVEYIPLPILLKMEKIFDRLS